MIERDDSRIEAARYALLSEVALLSAEATDLRSFLEEFTSRIGQVLDFDHCTLALLNGDAQTYQLQALSGNSHTMSEVEEASLPLTQGVAGAVIRSGQSRLIDGQAGIQVESRLNGSALEDGAYPTILSLPLQAYGKVIGALTFATTRSDGYSDEEIKLATSLAAQLALVIDRHQQTHQFEQTEKELTRLASFPELNPAAIIEWDMTGQVYYMNPAAERQFPEYRQLGFRAPLLGDLPDIVEVMREQGIRSQVREKKVGDTWYQQVVHLVPDSERFRSFVIDITERKRIEEALQQQNDYLAALNATTLRIGQQARPERAAARYSHEGGAASRRATWRSVPARIGRRVPRR